MHLKLTYLAAASLISALFVGVHSVQALELVIEENGSGSQSTLVTETTTSTQITQSNDTSTNTDVNVQADTGGNQTDDNSGDTNIETGDIDVAVGVDNHLNQTQVNTQDLCCSATETILNISGNGTDSINSIDVGLNTSAGVVINQTAIVENDIIVTANTGHNTVSANGGDVLINTGSISVNETVSNQANTTDIGLESCCGVESIIATIKNNGTGSVNSVSYYQDKTIEIIKTDLAVINNHLTNFLNTGENHADDNQGNIKIITGDITLNATVVNDPINENTIKIDCDTCDEPEPPDNPDDPDNPDNPNPPLPPDNPTVTPPESNNSTGGSSSNGGSGDSGGDGQVLGMSIGGAILPATGSLLYFFLIANMLMFLLGGYLRLHSGRSPAYAYAK
jgi:hypothetical protein